MDKQVTAFYDKATAFCAFMAGNTNITEKHIERIIVMLMELYSAALDLPDMEPESTKPIPNEEKPERIPFNLCFQSDYWEVFDPLLEDEPVCSNLADDLADISKDLELGISEYDSGKIGNAVFEWKLGLNSHWGQHLVDALRALHAIRTG